MKLSEKLIFQIEHSLLNTFSKEELDNVSLQVIAREQAEIARAIVLLKELGNAEDLEEGYQHAQNALKNLSGL